MYNTTIVNPQISNDHDESTTVADRLFTLPLLILTEQEIPLLCVASLIYNIISNIVANNNNNKLGNIIQYIIILLILVLL